MLFSPFGLRSLTAPHAPLAAGFEADIPETQVGSDFRVVFGGITRQDLGNDRRQSIDLGNAHVGVAVNGAETFIAHQVFHLTDGEILNVLLLRARFLDFRLAADPLVFVSGIEYSLFPYAHAPPQLAYPGRRIKKILRGILVARAQHESCIGRRGNVVLKGLSHAQQLRNALHGKQESRIGAARRLQDVGEIGVGNGREFVHDDRHERHVHVGPLALIAFADHQLQILQDHPPQRPGRIVVLVGIEGDEKDPPFLDDLLDRNQVLVGSGDDGELVLQEGHHLVDQTANHLHTLRVAERLNQVARTHLEIESLLVADVRQLLDASAGDGRLLLQHIEVVGHDQNVVDVVAFAGVIEDADDVGEVSLLMAVEEVFPQIKGLEDEADVLLVLAADGDKRIETHADLGPRGIDNAQVVQPPGSGDQRQQLVIKELAFPLAVDDNQRDLVTVALRPGLADQVLLDDVE